jgi:hypothetical protein
MSKTKEVEIEYPRHWWFSCSAFTCYIATDKHNNIDGLSTGIAKRYIGMPVKQFARMIQRKFGGVMINEYDKSGRPL